MATYPAGSGGPGNHGRVQVVTGDAVPLELSPAGLASRITALLLDIAIQLILLLITSVVVALIGTGIDFAATMAVQIGLTLLILVGYPTAFETLSRGRSLGKMALGLRVVGTDGSPERFRQALTRALVGFVEIWTLSAVPALFTSMLNPDGRRIGDFLAGTIVVQERTTTARSELIGMPPRLQPWASAAELSQVDENLLATARQYVLRYGELDSQTRHEMGIRVAASLARNVTPPPPPDTSPVEFLAAVLAERRRRAEEHMARQHGPAPGTPPPGHHPPPPGAWPSAPR